MLKKILFFLLFISLSFSAVDSFPQAKSEAQEYSLKAAFIYNFTKFIDWNSSNNGDEFIIGVMGYSPIIKYLTEIAQTKSVNGKKIVIKQFYKPDEIKFSHVLFIPEQCTYPLSSILSKVAKGTLT